MDLSVIRQLGDQISSSWRALDYDEQHFSTIATDCLGCEEEPMDWDLADIASWVLRREIEQREYRTFGDVPVLLYKRPRFHIELLVWLSLTTAIHSHAFSGAFRVLAGPSVHMRYHFEERERYNKHLVAGALQPCEPEFLKAGDVRSIEPGLGGLNHALFHVARPSVTLLARSAVQPWTGPAYSFSRPGLAYDEKVLHRDPEVQVAVRALQVLRRANGSRFAQAVVSSLSEVSFSTAFAVFSQLTPDIHYSGSLDEIVGRLQHRHGNKVALLEQFQADEMRRVSLAVLRERILDEEQRVFLALLGYAPDRDALFSWVGSHMNVADPLTAITGWVQELCRRGQIPLVLEDQASQLLLRQFVQGAGIADALSAIAAECRVSEEQAGQLRSIHELLRKRPEFSVFST